MRLGRLQGAAGPGAGEDGLVAPSPLEGLRMTCMGFRALLLALLLAVSAPARAAVDVNAADQAALQTIHGIGPVLAARILEARSQGGQFRDLDDLRERVKGVGTVKLGKMVAGGLVVGPAAAGKAGPAGASAAAGGASGARGPPSVELIVGNPAARSSVRR